MTLQIEVEGFSSVFLCSNWKCHHDIKTQGNQNTPPGHSSSYFLFLLHLALLYEDRQEDRRHDNPLCGNNYCDCCNSLKPFVNTTTSTASSHLQHRACQLQTSQRTNKHFLKLGSVVGLCE